jgi:Glycosyl hydrolases family 16
MSARAGVALVAGAAAILLVWAVARGVAVTACPQAPFDPVCVSVVFPTPLPPSEPGPSSSFGAVGSPAFPSGSLELPAPTNGVAYSFDDEFTGSSLSNAWGNHWGTQRPGRWSGSEVAVSNGFLSLTAERTPSGWQGGLIDTFATFRQQYGFFSARVKVPEGRGIWAAYWLAEDWQKTRTEVDIMEVCANVPGTHDGNDATLLHSILHAADGEHTGSQGSRLPDVTTDWHTIALDWRADHMSYYLDGAEIWRFQDVSNIPSVPLAVVFSLTTGGWCGLPDDTTPSPSVMQVDWVRVTP